MASAARAALDAEELEHLQSQLLDQMQAAGCMPLDIAHGFLTATAAAPGATVTEAALLDRILGKLAGDDRLRDQLARFRGQLLDDLRSAEYGPLIQHMARDDGSMLPLPYGWCQGYVAGVDFLGEQRRDRLLADEQAGALLTPVLSFLMYEEQHWFDPPNEAAHRETVGELGAAALALFEWWKGRLDT